MSSPPELCSPNNLRNLFSQSTGAKTTSSLSVMDKMLRLWSGSIQRPAKE